MLGFTKKKHFIKVVFTLGIIAALAINAQTLNAQTVISIADFKNKYLSSEEQSKLTEKDHEKLNYLLNHSYIIHGSETPDFKKWLEEQGGVFDIFSIKKKRSKEKRVFYRNERYPAFSIELLSEDELEAAYNEIDKNQKK